VISSLPLREVRCRISSAETHRLPLTRFSRIARASARLLRRSPPAPPLLCGGERWSRRLTLGLLAQVRAPLSSDRAAIGK
jgi:hypothetical protein